MSENPYASSATSLESAQLLPHEIVLAPRSIRLIARIVDALLEGFFFAICVLLIPGMQNAYSFAMENSVSEETALKLRFFPLFDFPEFSVGSLAFWGLSLCITFFCQAYFLAKYGQTIGKRLLRIKIVNKEGHRKPTLFKSFVVRECGIYLLHWIPFSPFIDALWIFGPRRKCLHDLWTGTIVINTRN